MTWPLTRNLTRHVLSRGLAGFFIDQVVDAPPRLTAADHQRGSIFTSLRFSYLSAIQTYKENHREADGK